MREACEFRLVWVTVEELKLRKYNIVIHYIIGFPYCSKFKFLSTNAVARASVAADEFL